VAGKQHEVRVVAERRTREVPRQQDREVLAVAAVLDQRLGDAVRSGASFRGIGVVSRPRLNCGVTPVVLVTVVRFTRLASVRRSGRERSSGIPHVRGGERRGHPSLKAEQSRPVGRVRQRTTHTDDGDTGGGSLADRFPRSRPPTERSKAPTP